MEKLELIKYILLWIFIFVIGSLIVSAIIYPNSLNNLKVSLNKFSGKIKATESIDMEMSCTEAKIGAKFMVNSMLSGTMDEEDIIVADCIDFCKKKKNMTYSSWGCPNDKWTCYCK